MLIFVNYQKLNTGVLTWYNSGMSNMKLAADFAIKHDDKADFMHTSGYAKAQNRESFGAAGAASFEARKAMDEQRKYIKSYKRSAIATTRFSQIHPKPYAPEKTTQANSANKAPHKPVQSQRVPGVLPRASL